MRTRVFAGVLLLVILALPSDVLAQKDPVERVERQLKMYQTLPRALDHIIETSWRYASDEYRRAVDSLYTHWTGRSFDSLYVARGLKEKEELGCGNEQTVDSALLFREKRLPGAYEALLRVARECKNKDS